MSLKPLHFLCELGCGKHCPAGLHLQHTGCLFASRLSEGYLQHLSRHSGLSDASGFFDFPSHTGKAYLTSPGFCVGRNPSEETATEEYLPSHNSEPLCCLLCFPFVVIWMTGIIWPLPTSNAIWGWEQASKHVLNPFFPFISPKSAHCAHT